MKDWFVSLSVAKLEIGGVRFLLKVNSSTELFECMVNYRLSSKNNQL